MSSIRNFFARLFTWPFFVGVGTGVFLTIGGAAFLSFLAIQQFGDESTTAPAGAPSISDRAAQSVHGTAPSDWSLRPVSSEADSTTFAEATDSTTVLNLWATWCGPCKAEMPSLQALHDSTGTNVSVVLVSRERKKKVRQFLEKKGYSMPVYVASDLPSVFDGSGIPRTYVIGADGRVLYRHVGAADWNADAVHRFLGRLNGNRPSGASS